ncbi:nudix (nucleoside diphosphate linked moiety X)-type motif 10 [Cricetulus griseus]
MGRRSFVLRMLLMAASLCTPHHCWLTGARSRLEWTKAWDASGSSAARRRPARHLQTTTEAAAAAAPRMKCKPNQTRTYDPEGFKKRAACLCFRSEREDEVLLVSSSRYPDRWIVPGGGMEPEEEPDGAAVREVYEEAGVKGKLGRLLGVFEQNQDRKHRTYVFVLTVTELLEDWEDSVSIGRKREWFKIEDAIKVLQCHKPVHAEYLEKLKLGGTPTNGNPAAPSLPESEP